jgi:hypothetical protein
VDEQTYFVLGHRPYTILKWSVKILLPAISAAIFALGGVWKFDAGPVIGTLAIITTFLGTLLGVSTINYNKVTKKNVVGEIIIPETDAEKIRMALDLTPEELKTRNAVIFRVKPVSDDEV